MIKFGTGGWRAVIADEFTKENIRLLMAGLCRLMEKEGLSGAEICVGYDRRFLSKESAHWAAEVLVGYGFHPFVINRSSPTPLMMFTVKKRQEPYGIAVTASHNPAIYNGIKVFTAGGRDADQTVTARIEAEIAKLTPDDVRSVDYDEALEKGLITEANPMNEYLDSILAAVDVDAIKKAALRIGFDPMYGVSWSSLSMLLTTCRCDLEVIHDRHDTLFGGKLPAEREDSPEDCDLKKTVCALRDRYEAEMEKLQLQNGLDEIFKVIDRANKYIDETTPWTLGKDESKRVRLATVLYNLLETIRVCTALLQPVMPESCGKIFAKIGADDAARTWDNANVWGVLPAEVQVSKGENLFPRVDVEATLEKLNAMQEAQKKAALPAVEVEPFVADEVDFDTFLKSDFRAVKIKSCEAVKKSDKLLKFTLDDGSGTDRIIVSGIHHYYEPEQLVGKTAVAIVNLPPRKMLGIPSCGMLLSAVHKEKGEEKLHLMLIDDSVPAGAKLC